MIGILYFMVRKLISREMKEHNIALQVQKEIYRNLDSFLCFYSVFENLIYFDHIHPRCSLIYPQLLTLSQLVCFTLMAFNLCCLYTVGVWTIQMNVVDLQEPHP